MNTKLVRFTKYLLDAMFYIGIVLTAAIPVLFYIFGCAQQRAWSSVGESPAL